MESKYYMPELSEFFDGFEYEHLESKIWRDSKFIFRDLNVISKQINNGEIRVKLLDREDIESLGCTMFSSKDDFTEFYFKSEYVPNHTLIIDGYNKTSSKKRGVLLSIVNFREEVLFSGYIKNKSELQKLLIQLGIK